MKKLVPYFLTAFALIAASCSDDDSLNNQNEDAMINQTEDTVLDAALVSGNIEISGASKNTGDAPAPNSSIPFTLESNVQSGFLTNGFDINFDAPNDFAGAYIQIKSEDDVVAGEYYDVPRSATTKEDDQTKRDSKFLTKSSRFTDQPFTIDVDFGSEIPPGKFCYIICVYDENGNISQPQEVCVEVEAWGGNSSIIGTWNYTKSIENGVTINLGETECESFDDFSCDNQNTLNIPEAYCYTINSLPIIFNQDGSYSYIADEVYRSLDFTSTAANCEVAYNEEQSDIYSSSGFWAYDEEEGRLTLVEFSYTEDGETITVPEGELLFDGDTTISGNELIIKETFEDDFEGILETYEFHFKKQ